MKLRLGTRGSDLARTQSGQVAAALAERGIETELVVIATSGDRSDAPSFGAIGPQGVFVREIEQALLAGEVDLAVHSYKDLPTQSPDGLLVAAMPARSDPADWLLVKTGRTVPGTDVSSSGTLIPLAPGARVGTASARRQAWLRHFHAELAIAPLRGNVPTRLRRLAAGDFDAILLAGAGIERLTETGVLEESLSSLERMRLDPRVFVPAPAQGALAVQCRAAAPEVRAALAALDDAPTRAAVTLERAALALAEGGCDTAFGAYAGASERGFRLTVMLERGGRVLRAEACGTEPARLAAEAFASLADSDRSAAR